jgi:hypothetical protein
VLKINNLYALKTKYLNYTLVKTKLMTTGYSPETDTSGIHKTRLNDEREVVDIDATDSGSCRKRD